jgi:hypothetical protein
LDHATSLHLVVYNKLKVTTKPTRNKPSVDPQEHDVIIAAASFMFSTNSVLVNWIMVARSFLVGKDNYVIQDLNSIHKGKTERCYLGTFLLCCIQKISYFKTNTFRVLLQANSNRKNGAYLFYRKNFFLTYRKENSLMFETMTEQKKVHKDFFIKSDDLKYMLCFVPIFLVHPWWLQNKKNIQDLQYVIETAAKYLLNLDDPNLMCDSKPEKLQQMITNAQEMSNIFPTFPTIREKHIMDSYENVVENNVAIKGDDNEIYSILSDANNDCPVILIDHKQGSEENGKSCVYCVLSVGLFGTKDYYRELC